MIDGFIITLDSQKDLNRTTVSSIVKTGSQVRPIIFRATTPDTIDEDLKNEFKYFDSSKFEWTWPRYPSQNHHDLMTGVYKFAYTAADQDKKIACSISHMRLWDLCVTEDKPIIIMEADAVFTGWFNEEEVRGHKLVGLNNPLGATRRADRFHKTASSKVGVQPVPTVNNTGEFEPQGLAGHSAYYIEPEGAKELLDKIEVYGMWPNDAYVCRELFPWIRIIFPYFTKVMGTQSTTTR